MRMPSALGLGDLLGIGRDLLGRLERDDGDVEHPGPDRRSRHVEGRGHRAPGVVAPKPPTGEPARAPRSPPAAARSAVRAASNATFPPPTTTSRSPRSTLNPWLTLSRYSTARRTPSRSCPGRSRSRARPVPTARKIAACRSSRSCERFLLADPVARPGLDPELEDRLDLPGDQTPRAGGTPESRAPSSRRGDPGPRRPSPDGRPAEGRTRRRARRARHRRSRPTVRPPEAPVRAPRATSRSRRSSRPRTAR